MTIIVLYMFIIKLKSVFSDEWYALKDGRWFCPLPHRFLQFPYVILYANRFRLQTLFTVSLTDFFPEVLSSSNTKRFIKNENTNLSILRDVSTNNLNKGMAYKQFFILQAKSCFINITWYIIWRVAGWLIFD